MNPPTRRRVVAVVEEEGRVAEKTVDVQQDAGLLTFVADIVIGFVFWSSLAEAVPSLWYIPMNLMEISGVEVLLLGYCIMGLLTFKSVRELTWNYPILHVLQLINLFSLYLPTVMKYGSVLMLGSTLHQVIIVGQLLHPSPANRERRIYTLMLGLFALVCVRFGLSSVSPLYLYPSANIFAAGLVVVCSVVLHIKRGAPARGSPPAKSFSAFSSDMGTGAGFGAFLFLTIMFLTEHGVLARWCNADTFLTGLGMMGCVLIGFILSRAPFVRSWAWYILAVVSTAIFVSVDTPIGAIAGFGLIIYLASLWQVVVESLNRMVYIGRALSLGGLVYLLGCLGTVWTVAYNFVPGGFFVREWTPQLVFLALVLTKLSYSSSSAVSSPSASAGSPVSKSEKTAAQVNYRYFLIGMALVTLVVFAPAFVKRFSSYNNFDANGLDKTNLRGMIWATHFGYDNFGRPSYEDMHRLITKSGANVIALVESDIMRLFNGNRDLSEWLQEKLHMYLDYGPGTNTHTWGCAILSAFPFKRVERVVLPSPDGENACLIDATLDVNGKDVEFIMAHFGNTEHVRDRELQTEDSYRRLKAAVEANKRVAWFGYFTAPPGSPNYNRIMSSGVIDTTDSSDRYCEYIWYKNMKLKEFTRIAQGHVSDTEIQYASFEAF